LVLPDTAGGYANGALAPASRRPVPDIAADLRAATDATAAPVAVRLSDETLNAAGLDSRRVLRAARRCDVAAPGIGLDELCGLLGPTGERLRALGILELRRVTDDPEPLGDLDFGDLGLGDLYDSSADFFEDHDQEGVEDNQALFEEEVPGARPAFVLVASAKTTREELRPSGERPPTLQEHASAVAERAANYLTRSGIPDSVAAAVVLAARVHDHGKGDPRFQAFFRGGITAFLDTPIAKSVFGTADVQASRAARAAAGLPRGLRHEIASVAALADAITNDAVRDMPEQVDVDLALHLVGTHHGLGRPVPRVPAPSTSAPREFAVNAAGMTGTARGDALEGWDHGAWLRRFFAVIDRYGPWGSAYLEALLILSDRTVSQEGG
ncbi:MAG: HD domain-containing protein, partial [Solirubrobacteraceae bacterium]